MDCPIYTFVPPYLLQGIIDSEHIKDEEARQAAQRSLQHHEQLTARRRSLLETLSQPRAARAQRAAPGVPAQQAIVPEVLLEHITRSEAVDEATKERAKRDLEVTRRATAAYKEAVAPGAAAEKAAAAAEAAPQPQPQPSGFYRAVYDAKHDPDMGDLPGELLRVEGQQPVEDATANAAFDNVGKVLEFYLDKFNWRSIDDRNMQVLSSVHYGVNFQNAFWDDAAQQMVFGDGHSFLYRFANCLDVIGHELTHAVTEHTSPLAYQGQSGALNEHVSDVFGVMCKQRAEDETADRADWLIGEGCLLPDVKGVAIRSMKDPGSAYKDPRFGKDPQPGSMADYKPIPYDHGGVHIYSGIPNKAFYLAAVAFGGYSWEKAGQIWWKAMRSRRVPPFCTFLQFADVTTEVAEELFGEDAAKIVRDAWTQVGVVRRF